MLYPNMPSVRDGSFEGVFSCRNLAVLEEFLSEIGPVCSDGALNW